MGLDISIKFNVTQANKTLQLVFCVIFFGIHVQRKMKNKIKLPLHTKHSLQSLAELCVQFMQRFTSFKY